MADQPKTPPLDPMAGLQSLLPGLAWTQAALDQFGRSQAALAADTLRRVNAPVVDAIARHREFAAALAATAAQLSTMASQLDQMARQHAELTEYLQRSLDPYLRYVDWLGEAGRPTDREAR